VLSEGASFPIALRLRQEGGVPIGELFSFLSGLYFRGKLEYAKAFCDPPGDVPGVLVITPNMGLVSPTHRIDHPALLRLSGSKIDVRNEEYRGTLELDAKSIAERIERECQVVLLGSMATEKYVSVLSPIFRDRLRCPAEFVGRGDMSRGSLLLRCVTEAKELEYIPADLDIPGRRTRQRNTSSRP
jgi:hypothetical protein